MLKSYCTALNRTAPYRTVCLPHVLASCACLMCSPALCMPQPVTPTTLTCPMPPPYMLQASKHEGVCKCKGGCVNGKCGTCYRLQRACVPGKCHPAVDSCGNPLNKVRLMAPALHLHKTPAYSGFLSMFLSMYHKLFTYKQAETILKLPMSSCCDIVSVDVITGHLGRQY